MDRVDLHTHTTASDGTFTPEESIARARANGLSAFAITDHDTVAAFPGALIEGKKHGVEIIPGIEISSVHDGKDIHVLGYYIDYMNADFLTKLEELRNVRNVRNQMIIDKLVSLGIPITMEEVRSRKADKKGNIGRPHIAEVLVEKGAVASMQQAFDKYLCTTGAAYTNPPRISPEEAIALIVQAGGVPVLAHPGLYKNVSLARELIGQGLQGIEVYHPDHGPEDEWVYGKLAEEFGLIKTGGSDFHGIRNGEVFHGDLGERSVPLDTLNRIKELARK